VKGSHRTGRAAHTRTYSSTRGSTRREPEHGSLKPLLQCYGISSALWPMSRWSRAQLLPPLLSPLGSFWPEPEFADKGTPFSLSLALVGATGQGRGNNRGGEERRTNWSGLLVSSATPSRSRWCGSESRSSCVALGARLTPPSTEYRRHIRRGPSALDPTSFA